MTAVDDDVGQFGEFEYSIGQDGEDHFTIDPQTGDVFTTKTIDREAPDSDAFIVSGQVSVVCKSFQFRVSVEQNRDRVLAFSGY